MTGRSPGLWQGSARRSSERHRPLTSEGLTRHQAQPPFSSLTICAFRLHRNKQRPLLIYLVFLLQLQECMFIGGCDWWGKRPGCGGNRFGPFVLKSGAGRQEFRALCHPHPSSRLTVYRLRSAFCFSKYFYAGSVLYSSQPPGAEEESRPGDEAAGERAVTAELGAPGSPPRCSERTEALPDRLVHQSLGVASARSSPCPLASPLRAETPLPLSSASRPRCPMPCAQHAPDTPRGLLAQASPSVGEGNDRILILGFFPGAPRTSPSLT